MAGRSSGGRANVRKRNWQNNLQHTRLMCSEILESRLLLTVAADVFEPNESIAAAYQLSTIEGTGVINGLSIDSTTDHDFFQFITSGTGTSNNYLDVRFSHAEGDLDARLLNSQGTVIQTRAGTVDNEQFDLVGLTSGTYTVEIFGFLGADNSYSLAFNTPEIRAADAFEYNNTLKTATDLGTVAGTLSLEDLSIHASSDRDFYRFVTTETGTADHYIEAQFSVADGDLDLRLFSGQATGTDTDLRHSYTAADNERISLQGLPAGTYYVSVHGNIGDKNDYDLVFNTPVQEVADRFEANDTVASATDFGTVSGAFGRDDLSIHALTDQDYYRFVTSGAGTAENYVDILFSQTGGDLDARLLNSQGTEVRKSDGVVDNERLSLQGLAAGTYFVQVYGYNRGRNNYSLSFNTPVAEVADRFEANNTFQTATNLGTVSGVLENEGLSIHTGSDRDFYKFVTTGVSSADNYVDVLFANSGGDLEANLLDSRGNTIQSSTGAVDNERLNLGGLVAGTYFVEVYGYRFARNTYRLSLNTPEAESSDRFEANNTLATATDLRTVVGIVGWDDLSIHSATDKDFFKIVTTEAGTTDNYVDVLFSHSGGDIDAKLLNSQGATVRSSVGVVDNERLNLAGLPAGTYFVQVYGYSAAKNSYRLSVNAPGAEPADRFEANNTLATATDLRLIDRELELSDLTLHGAGDVDFYKFSIPAGAAASNYVQASFSNAGGDINLRLRKADGTFVRGSTGTVDNERISLDGLAAGAYVLEVYGASSSVSNNYSLRFDAPGAADAWTIMVYMTASDLQPFGFSDINEMEQAISQLPGTVNVSVFWDQSSAPTPLYRPGATIKTYATGGGSQEAWGTAGQAFITADSNRNSVGTKFQGSSADKTLLTETNTGDPQTLIDFVNWSVTEAPAERYGLVMWDHGGGLSEFNLDNADLGQVSDSLNAAELVQALTTLRGDNIDIDLLAFDECLMATAELGHAVRGLTSTFVASQEIEGGDGYDYTTVFDVLESDPYNITAQALGTGFVRSYGKQYLGVGRDGEGRIADTTSALNAAKYNSLTTALKTFTTAVLPGSSPAVRSAISTARNATPQYGGQGYEHLRDLGGFMQRIVNNTAITVGIRTAATGVLTAISSAVVSKTADARTSSGITIFLPDMGSPIPSWYSTMYSAFDTATGWSAFLRGVNSPGTDISTDWSGTTNRIAARAFNLGVTAGSNLVFDDLSLENSQESDWFRFTLPQTGAPGHRIVANSGTSGATVQLELYDSTGTTLLQTATSTAGVTLNGRLAGEYTIRVSGSQTVSRYWLQFYAPYPPGSTTIPNNSLLKATSWGVVGGTQLMTGLVLPNSSSVVAEQNVWSYYTFDTPPSIPQQRFELAARSSTGVSLDVQVLDSSGAVVVSKSGTGKLSLVFNPLGSGESYKFRVRQTPSSAATFVAAFNVRFDTFVNVAPELNSAGSPLFDSVLTNATASSITGTSVSTLLARLAPGGQITDADPGALKGIAVNAAVNSVLGVVKGRWQYTLNGGTAWQDVGVVSNSSALLLAANDQTRLRFLPNSQFTGNVSIRFAAWDQSRGTNGSKANIAQAGGNSSFSIEQEVATLTVNTAPVLNTSGNPAFNSVTTGTTATQNRGNSVPELLTRLTPGGSITDVDSGALRGIAVNALTGTASGRWQYTLNNGTLWQNIGIVSNTRALLLSATSQFRIRFLPNSGFVGNVSLSFAAWDRTSGVSGTFVSLATRGGASAFSLQNEVAKLAVVNASAIAGFSILDDLFSTHMAFAN